MVNCKYERSGPCPYRAFILVWMADDKQINYNTMSDNAMPRDMMIVLRKSTFVIVLSKTD